MKHFFYLLSFLVLFIAACGDDDQVVPDEGPTQGLTAYYPLDGNAVDSVNGNNGQVFGPETSVDRHGNGSGALAFDGRTDYVSIPNAVANNFGSDQDFALSIWVRFGAQRGLLRNTNTILEKYDDGAVLTRAFPYAVRIFNQDAQLPGTVFARRLSGDDVDNCDTRSTVHASEIAINDDEFHHLVFQRSEGMLELFIDGMLHNTRVDSSSFTGCTTRNTVPIHLGARYDTSMDFHHFQGSMDDFRIYNRALSASEITWLFDH